MREAAKVELGKTRLCAATRERRAEDDLLRFVADPQGRIIPDLKRRLPGRGVWITASREAVGAAVKRQSFARALRRAVSVDEALPEQVEALLRKAALERLAMANKAGLVIAGSAKIAQALRAGRVAVLLHSAQASPDGCRKLDALAGQRKQPTQRQAVRQNQPLPAGAAPISEAEGMTITILRSFTTAELSGALGRANAVHAALAPGGATESFLKAARRLDRYTHSSLDLRVTP